MKLVTLIVLLFGIGILTFLCSCSKADSTLTPSDVSKQFIPLSVMEFSSDGKNPHTIGILGIYEMNVDIDEMKAELVPVRTSSLGQSFLVNGVSFFTITPCSDCLKLKSIELTPDNFVQLNFNIRHPFLKGDILKPPSALNRLDLDVFDPAALLYPLDSTPSHYPALGADIFDNIPINQSGYTKELSEVTGTDDLIPFFLVIDDSVSGTSSWNKFEMGSESDFSMILNLTETNTNFNLYLTMGYGASATRPTRLIPTYYNPEFNRKNAWKVDVSVSGNWQPWDNTTLNNVIVETYDWQTDATVNPELANPDEIYASSNISLVSLEIPGMFDSVKTLSNPDLPSTGMPGDPLIYTFPVANENLLGPGDYTGLASINDERVPPTSPAPGQTDALVDVPDGVNISYIEIPEFVTYQTFKVTVDQFPEPAVVTSIDPDSGLVNSSLTDVVISGSNFASDCTVELEYEPGDTIAGENVEWIDPGTLEVDFDLDGATIGFYDVRVLNPHADPGVLEDAFEVYVNLNPLWTVSQGNSAHTGYVNGLNGPTGVLSTPVWTSEYFANGNSLSVFLNTDTAFFSNTGWSLGYLPAVAVNLSDGSTKWTQAFHTANGDWLNVKGLSEDGQVVICSQTPQSILYGLDADDGHELWNIPGLIPVDAYPALDLDGNFIVPIDNVGFRSIQPNTGTVNWTAGIGDPYYCSPAVGSNGVIYCYVNGLTNAYIHALNPSNGNDNWSSFPSIGRTTNGVTVHPNGTIIIHGDNGLYCFQDNGSSSSQVWHQSYSNPWYCSTAVGPDDDIFVIDYGGVLRKLDPSNGNTIQSTSGWESYGVRMAIGDDGLMYTNNGYYFRCFNPDCTQRWNYYGTFGGYFGAPAIDSNGTVYAAKRQLGLYAWHD